MGNLPLFSSKKKTNNKEFGNIFVSINDHIIEVKIKNNTINSYKIAGIGEVIFCSEMDELTLRNLKDELIGTIDDIFVEYDGNMINLFNGLDGMNRFTMHKTYLHTITVGIYNNEEEFLKPFVLEFNTKNGAAYSIYKKFASYDTFPYSPDPISKSTFNMKNYIHKNIILDNIIDYKLGSFGDTTIIEVGGKLIFKDDFIKIISGMEIKDEALRLRLIVDGLL